MLMVLIFIQLTIELVPNQHDLASAAEGYAHLVREKEKIEGHCSNSISENFNTPSHYLSFH